MAYGNNSNGPETLLSFRIVTKLDGKNVQPHFSVSRKNKETGKWENNVEQCTFVEGVIESLYHVEGDWEGEPIHNISVYLVDDEKYKLDLRLNMLGRSILNSLLKAGKGTRVKIQVYENEKGYPAASVRVNDQLVEWKYSLDDQPSPKEQTWKGKIQRDYSEVDDFFLKKLKSELGMRSSGDKPEPSEESTARASEPESDPDEVVHAGEVDEDIPF